MSYSLLCLSILSITSSSTIMISDHSKIQFFILIPILSLSLFVSILTQPIQSLPILQSSSNQQRSLEDGNCSLLSSFIYGWMAKIMSVKDLKRDDIYMLSVLNRTGILSWKFGNLSQEKSLLWRIIRANVSDIVIDFSLKLYVRI